MGGGGKGGSAAAAPQQQNRPQYGSGPAQMAMPAFHMPEMPAFHMPTASMPSGPSYEEQMAEQKRNQGIADRDSLYSERVNAASSSADYINSEIQKEEANARLLGIDYKMDDAMKSQRVNDYFASVWGEGDEKQLTALMGEYGNPKGFTEFSVTRGDGSKYASGSEASETEVGKSKGQKPKKTVLTDEEEVLGSGQTVLGA